MTGARCSPAASGALWWPCSHVIHNTTHTPQGHFLQLCDRDAFWVGVNAFRAAATIYGPLFVASGLLSGKLTNPRFVLFKLLPSIARSSLFVACIGFFWVRFACLGRQITGELQYPFVTESCRWPPPNQLHPWTIYCCSDRASYREEGAPQ